MTNRVPVPSEGTGICIEDKIMKVKPFSEVEPKASKYFSTISRDELHKTYK